MTGFSRTRGRQRATRTWSGPIRVARPLLAAVLTLSILVAVPVSEAARPVVASLGDMAAVVTGSDSGVNVRAKPSFDARVLMTLDDGTTVKLRIADTNTVLDADGVTRWWPIRADGQDGWVTGYYLNDPEGVAGAGLRALGASDEESGAAASASSPGASTETPATEASSAPKASAVPTVQATFNGTSATARVASPAGLNVRTKPESDAPVLNRANEGALLVMRTDQVDSVTDGSGIHWWPVDADGEIGWVDGAYLTSGADETTVTSASTSAASVPFTPGMRATASTGTNDGVNIRAEGHPTSDVVGYIRPGDVVQVMRGPDGYEASTAGWYLVTNGNVTGYVDGDLLQPAEQLADTSAAAGDASTVPAPDAPNISGSTVRLATGNAETGGVNIRDSVGLSATVVGTAPEQALGTVLDGPFSDPDGGTWYYVTSDYGEGFVSAGFVTVVDQAGPTEAEATQAAAPTVPAPTATEAPASSAQPAATQAPASAGAGVATGTFIFPVAGRISQSYGCSSLAIEPYNASVGCNFHDAIDIAAPLGTPIMAADGGNVTFAGWCDCGLGYMVTIDHGNGYTTTYGHMSSQPYVSVGQAVAQGDVIGPVGSTGNSTGPHTHFMVELNGQTIDPTTVLTSLAVS